MTNDWWLFAHPNEVPPDEGSTTGPEQPPDDDTDEG